MAWRGRAAGAAIALSLLSLPVLAADAEPAKPAPERPTAAREMMVQLMTIFAYHYAPQGFIPAAAAPEVRPVSPPVAPLPAR
jgi:hypothetical protein